MKSGPVSINRLLKTLKNSAEKNRPLECDLGRDMPIMFPEKANIAGQTRFHLKLISFGQVLININLTDQCSPRVIEIVP